MKIVPKMPIPWDMLVFLTITSVGFGFSVNRLVNSPNVSLAAREPSAISFKSPTAAQMPSMQQTLLDLGCIETRIGGEKWTTSQSSIRLRGKFCQISRRAMRSFQGMRVKNLSNGYEGTTFLQGREPAFVTDDVVLQKGRNLIQIEWKERADNGVKIWNAEVYED